MKVLFIDSANKALIEILEKHNFECHYEPEISEKEIFGKIEYYEGVITRNKIIFSKEIIDKSEKLKFIGCIGSSLENIETDYAKKKGILCLNATEGNSDSVGEHAIAMLLNLFNNLCRSNMQVKNGIWKREANRGIEIRGKTIGIIGYGNTGSAFAKKLSGFDVEVVSYDKYKKTYEDGYSRESSMEEIFKKTDILSLHLPLTDETHYMVNYHYLNKFSKSIYLINTSRGQIVNTKDLANSMIKGKVLGAALDVLEYEKSSFENLHFGNMPGSMQYLIDSDNVIFSPHIAGWTVESEYKLATFLANKIVQHFVIKK